MLYAEDMKMSRLSYNNYVEVGLANKEPWSLAEA